MLQTRLRPSRPSLKAIAIWTEESLGRGHRLEIEGGATCDQRQWALEESLGRGPLLDHAPNPAAH